MRTPNVGRRQQNADGRYEGEEGGAGENGEGAEGDEDAMNQEGEEEERAIVVSC